MLTVADVLQMPAVRGADPDVVAGVARLDHQVRWVHTTELADIGPLLRGGDLVLTTGIALPDHADGLTRFVASLAESGAAGLFVELGRRWSVLPAHLLGQCEARGMPLVALRREVRFAAIAQAVGERLVDDQLAELRAAQRVHDTFTALSIDEAGPAEILAAAQRLSGAPVVLESGQHRIVDYVAGPADATFLDDWERRSRNVRSAGRTSWDASNGWLVTRVGRPERDWGRLVVGAPIAPSPGMTAVAERAAAALALHRLHDRTRDGQARRVHHEVLTSLLAGSAPAETHRRAEIAGLPPGRQYVGVALRPARDAQLDDLVAACLRAAEVTRTPALVSVFESEVRGLLALPPRGDAVRAVDRWAGEVTRRVPAAVTAGSAVAGLASADRTLQEASQVLAALDPGLAPGAGVHRLEDVHVRGLLTLLADDPRLRAFTERELGPLLEADRSGADLMRTARSLVEHWGSKSAAAAALNVSRPALYDRIARLETVLGGSLADAERRTSLHLALLAADAHVTSASSAPPTRG